MLSSKEEGRRKEKEEDLRNDDDKNFIVAFIYLYREIEKERKRDEQQTKITSPDASAF